MAALREIDAHHGLIPTELTRRLIESAVDFYRKNGWFSFPVEIYPRAHQQAAEATGSYSTRKKAPKGPVERSG